MDVRLDENNIQMSVQKSKIQGNDAVADVEQLPGCSAFGCRADSSQFMEYWVPTQLSHVQLEKYCSVLLSSSLTLCSSLKSDIFGALGDVLADTRKVSCRTLTGKHQHSACSYHDSSNRNPV